jgi:hypothetical protein
MSGFRGAKGFDVITKPAWDLWVWTWHIWKLLDVFPSRERAVNMSYSVNESFGQYIICAADSPMDEWLRKNRNTADTPDLDRK